MSWISIGLVLLCVVIVLYYMFARGYRQQMRIMEWVWPVTVGEIFRSIRCDCGARLEAAMDRIQRHRKEIPCFDEALHGYFSFAFTLVVTLYAYGSLLTGRGATRSSSC